MRTLKALFPVLLTTTLIAMVLVMGAQIKGETEIEE
jgi:hypothetical protein